ncbi:hypothetical protein AXA44_34615 [Rhodococcus sp. SC4]|nr:hypothetical protein AXA44_34615 [Rhodococcus sp. SC4]
MGFLGASTVAGALAARLIKVGHEVVLSNNNHPEQLRDIVEALGPEASAGSAIEAARAPVVVLAVPWPKVRTVLAPLTFQRDQILVDATNIFSSYAPEFTKDDLGEDTGSAIIAALAPGTRVVKAFNTLPIDIMFTKTPIPGGRRVLFLAGDDSKARNAVAGLIDAIGLAPIDIGDLAHGGRLMELGGSLSGTQLIAL